MDAVLAFTIASAKSASRLYFEPVVRLASSVGRLFRQRTHPLSTSGQAQAVRDGTDEISYPLTKSRRRSGYGSHARFLPAFHFFAIPVLLANLLNALRHTWITPSPSTAFSTVVAAAIVVIAFLSRVQVLRVQDRVIRLEMQLRLREVLPSDLRDRISDLTAGQLVALRFASDGELPELVREVLAGNLRTQKDIKIRIKSWQPDHLRA